MHHNPQIDPIYKRGTNGAGALVIHGFTGTPDSVRPVVNALHDEGFTVTAPLLKGHGTTPEDCSKTNWKDWYASAQNAYIELQEKCSKIFVCGLSLGSLLSLKLALDYPQSISALACLATPLYLRAWVRSLLPLVSYTPLNALWKYQKKYKVDIKDPEAANNFWNYDLMPLSCIASITELQTLIRDQLLSIKSPLLLAHSRHDSTAPYNSMNIVATNVSSAITETVTLENSYHVITIDYDKELVSQKVTDFFKRFI